MDPTLRADRTNYRPLIAAGLVMGAGLGGFIDGIVLHQIAQWHNMLSAQVPVDGLASAKTNMLWDGIFHAGVWLLTVAGLAMLWGAGRRSDVPWSGRTFVGGLVAGWGLFNVVEGVIDHQILGLHHVNEYSPNRLAWDIGFLVLGAALLAVGRALIRAGKGDPAPGASVRLG
ncbi:DUF2243 domain-containing protein [Rubrivirga marina]|uniref:DUF2243 domain-containing protein n=1 Tax=Rubrivirga marina TaxID=1196024 RepID=A0A271J3D2_9BACT|nr:DUF2243 domain-containing protein [Rubrivirga marina]PAP77209.1 hypothetical protein BSZ37_12590 [Rubrivirga marina]